MTTLVWMPDKHRDDEWFQPTRGDAYWAAAEHAFTWRPGLAPYPGPLSVGALGTAELHLALQELQAECGQPGWDGYSAEAVSQQTVDVVRRFLAALPTTIPAPELVPEPTGDIGLEWRNGPKNVLVVSLRQDRTILYAGMQSDTQTIHGTSQFHHDVVPPFVLAIIHAHVSGRAA